MAFSTESEQEFLDLVAKRNTPAVQDAVPDQGRYAYGVESAARQSMLNEQADGGSEQLVRNGLQNVRNKDKLAEQARRSTRAALEYASEDLAAQSAEIAMSDPNISSMLLEQAGKVSELANSIQSTTQDVQLGVNLRYGTPFGSGRETASASDIGGNLSIMPQYGNISRDSAMNIPLRSSYGTKNLGDRIEAIQAYAKEHKPIVKALGGTFAAPGFAQYHNSRLEGLYPKDWSLEGWEKAVGSGGMQAMSPFIMAAGGPAGVGVGAGMGAAGTMYARSDMPEAYDETGEWLDKAGEFVTETALGAVAHTGAGVAAPRIGAKLGKIFKSKVESPIGTPMAPENLRRAKLQSEVDRYDDLIKEQRPIASGDGQAVESAFVDYAKKTNGYTGDPSNAWRYNPGYVSDEFGGRAGKEAPWVLYAKDVDEASAKTINRLNSEKTAATSRMEAKKKALAEAEANEVSDFPIRQSKQAYDDVIEAERQSNKAAMEKAFTRGDVAESRRIKAEQNQKNSVYTSSEQVKINELNAEIDDYVRQVKEADRQLALNPSDKDAGTLYDKAFKKLSDSERKLNTLYARANDRRLRAVERAKNAEEDAKRAFDEAVESYQNPKTSKGSFTAQRNLELAENNYRTALAQKNSIVNELRNEIAELEKQIGSITSNIHEESKRAADLLGEKAQSHYKTNAVSRSQINAQNRIKELEKLRDEAEAQLKALGETFNPGSKSGGFSVSPFIAGAVSLGSGAGGAEALFHPGFSDADPVHRVPGSVGQEATTKGIGEYFGASSDDDVARFKGFRKKKTNR